MPEKDRIVGQSVGWHRSDSTPLFESRWYDLRQDHVRLPTGKEITYTWMEHPGGALVIPLTPANEVILIHTYRYPIDGWCWCLPGGGMGDKPERTPEEVAREELAEEIGGQAERLESLGKYFSATGVARLELHYFLGHNVRTDDKPRLEATEVIDRVQAFPWDEVLEMIFEHRALETESAFGILLAARRLGEWRPRKPR
jgi:ADP-ribose pyrophosphatase